MTDADPFVTTFHQWMGISMHRSMRNFIHYVRDSGLSMSQLGVLFHLTRMGSSGVTDLAGHLGVSNAAASQMLERLVQQGLILRSEDPNDRRVKQVILTERGSQVLEESIRARQSWLDELEKALSDDEKEQVIAALQILIDKTTNLDQTRELQN